MARTKQTARKETGGKIKSKIEKKNEDEKEIIVEENNEFETLKAKWFEDSGHDPRNPEKRVYFGKGPYNKLVEEFGDPGKKQKRSPKASPKIETKKKTLPIEEPKEKTSPKKEEPTIDYQDLTIDVNVISKTIKDLGVNISVFDTIKIAAVV